MYFWILGFGIGVMLVTVIINLTRDDDDDNTPHDGLNLIVGKDKQLLGGVKCSNSFQSYSSSCCVIRSFLRLE